MTTNHKQPVPEKFDQQKVHDMLNIVAEQRNRAMDICVKLESEVLARDYHVGSASVPLFGSLGPGRNALDLAVELGHH